MTRVLGVVVTFCLVSVAWVFFRSATLDQSLTVLRHLFVAKGNSFYVQWITRTSIAVGFIFIALLLILERYTSSKLEELKGRFWPDIAFGVFMLTSILMWGVFSGQSFIYFQF